MGTSQDVILGVILQWISILSGAGAGDGGGGGGRRNTPSPHAMETGYYKHLSDGQLELAQNGSNTKKLYMYVPHKTCLIKVLSFSCFINIFSRWVTFSHSQAKCFELNFFIRELNFP